MKLKSALKELELPVLTGIQQAWQLPEPAADAGLLDSDQWVDHLYPRLQNPVAFRKVYDQLDEPARNLLCFLAIHGGIMDEKELRKRFFQGDREAMKAATESLMNQALLGVEKWVELEEKPRVYGIPEPFLRFIDLPHFWKGYLGGLLRELPTEQLQKIALGPLGLRIHSIKRDHLIYEIRRALTDPDTLRHFVDALPEAAREIFFHLLHRRGVCVYRDLLEGGQGRQGDVSRSEAIEYLLASTGLLFVASDNAVRFQNLLRVPRDIYHIITNQFARDQRGLDELDAINQVDPKVQPKIILDNAVCILRDVVIFASQMARNSVRRLGNGGIGKKDLKKVLPLLSANKTLKYAQFLAFYCICRRFLIPMGESWRLANTFRDQMRDARAFYVDLYSFWFETNEWNEEYIEGDCIHSDGYPTNLVDIVELRRVVLDNLAKIPFDTWIDGPRFIESLLAQIELRMPKRGSKGRLDKSNRINYMAIESILCESLYWLGLISLGMHERTSFGELGNRTMSEGDSAAGAGTLGDAGLRFDHHFNFNPRPLQADAYLFHFKINNLGRSILRAGTDSPAKLANPKTALALPFRDDLVTFTVLPNLDVIAPPDLNLQHFLRLTEFAEIRNIDVMSTLAITHDSLRAAMDQGQQDQDILKFLEESCPNKLPETVYHLISECGNRYGEITIGYAGGFIDVEDPVLLEDLKNNKVLAASIKDIIQNRLVLLGRGVDVQQMAKELQRMGFMPSIDSEYVHATSEGRLHFTVTPEELCDLLAILQFVQQMEKTLEAPVAEDRARPLLHSLRPTNLARFNLSHYGDVLANRFQKAFEAALKKKTDAVSGKYRKQIRDFLAQRPRTKEQAGYQGPNPAEQAEDIVRLIRHAIEHEMSIDIQYARLAEGESAERVNPESLNGDRLYAFSEARQAYSAFRLSRIKAAKLL